MENGVTLIHEIREIRWFLHSSYSEKASGGMSVGLDGMSVGEKNSCSYAHIAGEVIQHSYN